VNTSLGIVSSAVESTAIPSLVSRDELADANGKLRAGYAAAQVTGPLLAGALIGGGLPVTGVFAIDAVSFWLAAVLLLAIRTRFSGHPPRKERRSVASDIGTGLRYVLADPVLRGIALHAALYNLIGSTVTSQLVLFAHQRLGADDAQVGLLFACGALGTAVALFAFSRLARQVSFTTATLGVMMCWSVLVLGLSVSTDIRLGAVFWACAAGLPSVYAVRTLTLRQTVVPDHLLGRVQTTGQVLAWSAQPVGAFIGAWLISATGRIAVVYAGTAVLMAAATGCFWRLGPLGKAGGESLNEPHPQMSDVPAEVLGKIRSAVQALPQVSDAVALDWRVPLPMRGRHLADVLPNVLPTVSGREPTDTAEGPGADTTEDATAAPDDGTPAEGGAREPSVLGSGSLGLPVDHPRTLQAALARAAEEAPERGITFLTRQGTSVHVTYPRLLADAERALAGLRALGLRPGDSVLFQFDANHSFVTAFWACVLGGFLPAPMAVVPDGERGSGKLRNTWSLLGHPLILTDLDAAEPADALSGQWGTGVRVAAIADIMADRRDRDWFAARPDSPALNLLTSGSTGLPKCVRHNHHSIVARTWGDAVVNRLTEDDVTLNWIAMDHVMGSVMAHTRDVFLGCAQVNVTPDMFAARPLNWLDWIDRYRVTNISAPNFAFALVNGYADEIAEGRWDLSSLRVVYNGGEPVVSGTAHTFLT
ncbi:MFS transporter, partial [Streptomyces sp. 2MCAF27]